MRRLTTPLHVFTLKIDPREWDEFLITYKQNGTKVLEKSEKDISIIDMTSDEEGTYKLSYRLTQKETKRFAAHSACEIQIRCHYPDGEAMASDIITMKVEDVLNDTILGGDRS